MASAPQSIGSVARHLGCVPPPHSSVNNNFEASLLNVAECQKEKLESATACKRTGCVGSLMSSSNPYPEHAPAAYPAAGYTVMSWHCDGPLRAPAPGRRRFRPIALSESTAALVLTVSLRKFMTSATRRAALSESAAVAVAGMPNRPRKRFAALTAAPFAVSATATPCVGGAVRSLKIRGELTIFACSGCANGTRMTSMRKSAVLGSVMSPPSQPAISLVDRTRASPDTYP